MTTTPLQPQSYKFIPPSKPRSQRAMLAGKVRSAVAAPPPTVTSMIITWVLATLSVALLWFVFYATVLSSLQFAHHQHDAYALFREELTTLSPRTAPLGGRIAPDAPVALIDSPALGLKNLVVIEGTASGDLTRGPGHKRSTPLPGQAGTSMIYGRSNLFSGVFGDVAKAQPGDVIKVTTGQGPAVYRVEDVRHKGDPFPISLQDGQGRLTLVTAQGGRWSNGWRPTEPVYVDARLQTATFATPPGRVSVVPRSEETMKGDFGALFSLVLWIPLLLMVFLAIAWAFERWGRWQTWLVGAPLVLAALWGVSETAVQLLPNLM